MKSNIAVIGGKIIAYAENESNACWWRMVRHLARGRSCKCTFTPDAEMVPAKDCTDGLLLHIEYSIAKKRMQEMRGE